MRLIDADSLKERVRQVVLGGSRYSFVTLENAMACIDQEPTVTQEADEGTKKNMTLIHMLRSAKREICVEPGTGRAVMNMTPKSAREFLEWCAIELEDRDE